jgi:hypothetical protein
LRASMSKKSCFDILLFYLPPGTQGEDREKVQK